MTSGLLCGNILLIAHRHFRAGPEGLITSADAPAKGPPLPPSASWLATAPCTGGLAAKGLPGQCPAGNRTLRLLDTHREYLMTKPLLWFMAFGYFLLAVYLLGVRVSGFA